MDERDYIFRGTKRLDLYVIFHLNNLNKIPFGIVNCEKYNIWDKTANTRINTGLLTILDILSTNAREVYIKGFTFFKDGYINNYRDTIGGEKTTEETSSKMVLSYMDKYKKHDQHKQWIYFKTIIQDENVKAKIKMDNALTEIMNLSNFDS